MVFRGLLAILGTLFIAFTSTTTFNAVQQCGKLNETQLSNGKLIAELNEHPWIARIEFTDSLGDRQYLCLGALIAPRHVVTAAHCLSYDDTKLSAVVLGDWDSSNNITEQDCSAQGLCAPLPQRIEHQTVAIHPEYAVHKIDNDIAVIELARNVEISDYVQPICLATAEEVSAALHVSGFLRPRSQRTMQRIKMPFRKLPTEECQKKVRHNTIATSNICGISDFNPMSGAALIEAHGEPRRFQLVGIAAAGFNSEPSLHLHTNIRLHLDWIQQNSKV